MKTKIVRIGRVAFGGKTLSIIAGPCVIESRRACVALAVKLKAIARRARVGLVFKASFDKANRSSINSYRGPGLDKGLEILAQIKEEVGLPVLTDVHDVAQVEAASRVVDALQIPAFLCRQTDLLVAAGQSGKVVNVKKGQFLAPDDMANVISKLESTGNRRIMLTERGSSFGYNNLVADMRSIVVMKELGYPVIIDATHSVQRPGGMGDHSGGDAELAPFIARAAVATGCDGAFIETHVNPSKALSDGSNMVPLADMGSLLRMLRKIKGVVSP
jgi:2-dehydro-3-deoxyphosphooctonate aldolase (KDO 8-P synthase)